MIGRAGFSSKCWRVLRWAGLAAAAPALWACTSRTLETPNITPTATLTHELHAEDQQRDRHLVHDRQLVVDDRDAAEALRSAPAVHERAQEPAEPAQPPRRRRLVGHGRAGRLDQLDHVHQGGDQGQFQSMPRGTCTATTLTAGRHLHLRRRHDAELHRPDIANVFQCIALLGDKGCGFEHQLASIDRALGGDGQQPQHERRLPAARGLPRHRHPDQRG